MKKNVNPDRLVPKQPKNYFDAKKRLVFEENFKTRGLFQKYPVSREIWNEFIQILSNKPFSYYDCSDLKDKNKEEVRLFETAPNNMNFKSRPRILIFC